MTGIVAGQAIQWNSLQFSAGNYKVAMQYSSTAVHAVRLSIDSIALPDLRIPSMGSMNTLGTISLGALPLTHGQHTIRIDFIDAGVDWICVKKYDPLMAFTSALTNCYLTAESGGNNTIVSNRTAAGIWEDFFIDDNSGQAVLDGDSVNLQCYDGLYLSAANGGGAALTIDKRAPR